MTAPSKFTPLAPPVRIGGSTRNRVLLGLLSLTAIVTIGIISWAYINDYVANLGTVTLLLAITAGFVGVLWHTVNAITSFDDTAEIGSNNFAYTLQRIGICAGQIIGMLPALEGYDSSNKGSAVLWVLAEGAWVAMALIASRLIVDWAILPKINNVEQMRRGNLAIGIVEAGCYTSFGFLLRGSMIGDAPNNATYVASTVTFFLVGVAFTMAMYYVHELVTPYSIREGIKAGHLPHAIETAAILIAISNVIGVSLAGTFTTWTDSFKAFGATAVISVLLVYAFRFVIDMVILRSCTVKSIIENNLVAASVTMGGLLVLSSFPVASLVGTQL